MRVKGRAHPARIYAPFDALGATNGAWDTLAPAHEEMLKAYRSKEWDAAEAAIAKCETSGVDRLHYLYELYRERIAEWRLAPPPEDWDGTFTATSK